MRPPRLPCLFALGLILVAVYPVVARWREAVRVLHRLDGLAGATGPQVAATSGDKAASPPPEMDPALLVRVEELGTLLASWQTIGGCGSSGATGSAGIKWIGRGTTGGLFNVQVQANYSELGAAPYLERNLFLNTLITRDIAQKWNVGVNVPYVYKYLNDPLMQGGPYTAAIDYSNGGLGDVGLQGTHRFGSINDTAVTLVVGMPTGTYQATYNGVPYPIGKPLRQQQQLGFGRVTAAAVVDHTMDQVWGVIVVGGVAAYRGGKNSPLDNYRAPSATGYGYTGYFWGPLVPAFGLAVTGFSGHDRDQTQEENSGLLVATPTFSLEWSTDWLALLAGAAFPYQYDGISKDANGAPRSPSRWGPWLVAFGVAVSPF